MPISTFFKNLTFFFAFAALLYAAAGRTEAISEAEVRAFLDEISQAVRDKDTAAIADAIAPDALLSFRIRTAEKEETVELNRDEYIFMLEQILPTLIDYEFDVEVKEIAIEESGERAKLVVHVRERLVWPERKQDSFTVETMLVERRGGRLLIVLVAGEVDVQEAILTAQANNYADGLRAANRKRT